MSRTIIKVGIIFCSMQLMAETTPVSSVNYESSPLNIIDVTSIETAPKKCYKKEPQNINQSNKNSMLSCMRKSDLRLITHDKNEVILPNISLSDSIKDINKERTEAFKQEISEEQIIIDDVVADAFTTTLLGLEGLTNLLFAITEREKYKKDIATRETDFADVNNVFTNTFLKHYFPETARIYDEYSFKSGFSNRNYGDVMGIRKHPIPLAFQELDRIRVAKPLFTDDYNYYAYLKKIAIFVGVLVLLSLFRKN